MAVRPSILNIQTRSWAGGGVYRYTGGDSTLVAKVPTADIYIYIYTAASTSQNRAQV